MTPLASRLSAAIAAAPDADAAARECLEIVAEWIGEDPPVQTCKAFSPRYRDGGMAGMSGISWISSCRCDAIEALQTRLRAAKGE